MSEEKKTMDSGRRTLLVASTVTGGVAVAAAAVPFVASFAPSDRARAAGAPVKADIGDIGPGEMKVFEWRGKPVWVLRRTPEMLESLKQADA
ncbi:MAG: ubiquinol-cytochrome c reductase iron-sulfur subunit, partial [Rhodocyclaceae bacterium]|nr:ubiquinol-cytochrome c reductase iron-sulfur subunit [Rhodocyclaceae bacterium]